MLAQPLTHVGCPLAGANMGLQRAQGHAVLALSPNQLSPVHTNKVPHPFAASWSRLALQTSPGVWAQLQAQEEKRQAAG